MAPDVGIFLIWTGTCVFLLVDHVNGDDKCIFPFTYGGKKFFDCTNYGSLHNWCALNAEYTGRWKYCTKDDYAQCFFPFIYNGKPYDQCTTDGSAFNRLWCSLTSNYDEDKFWKHCY